jgi:L-alanine-DL-glutamate epimerase-like enolase superfamily enzyme
MTVSVARITIWPLEIPMRRRFRHAAAKRDTSRPLLVEVELTDNTLGYGETHPREYVTGETDESALRAVRDVFLPLLVDLRVDRFSSLLEALDSFPFTNQAGACIAAARAGVELALLDAYSRSFKRSLEEVAGWLDTPGFGSPGSLKEVRYSGVLGSDDPRRIARGLRAMRCFGLRHFKLKVGDGDDDERLAAVVQALRRPLQHGRATLRLDANGAWSLDQAHECLERWASYPIVCVEQPLARGREEDLATLASASSLPLMADESLVTSDDAENLIVRRAVGWFNIRLSKNGGLLPAMRLAALARQHGIEFILGCMVGETSVLSAAGRCFLHLVAGARFAEGSYGRFLLRGDVASRSIRFGWGGKASAPQGPGWGVEVRPDLLQRRCPTGPIRFPL